MRIWLNQSHSLTSLVRTVRAERQSIDLCISTVNPIAPSRTVAAESWNEPAWDSPGYAEWALDTAVEKQIDVFAPQRGRRGIAAIADRFAAAGIRLESAADAQTLDLIDDKVAFSQDLADHPLMPMMIRATDAAEFERAVAHVVAERGSACVKPSRGIFGQGYWTLATGDAFTSYEDPDARIADPVAYAEAMRSAGESGRTFDLAVMEHLPGVEASVDVIAERGQTRLAATRIKVTGTRQSITNDHELIGFAADLVQYYRLNGAVNVQFKKNAEGDWRILEINARIAGGASYNDVVGIPYSVSWMDMLANRSQVDVPLINASVDGILTGWPS